MLFNGKIHLSGHLKMMSVPQSLAEFANQRKIKTNYAEVAYNKPAGKFAALLPLGMFANGVSHLIFLTSK